MPGPVALVGAGAFLPPMAEFDAGLIRATGRRRPRVAIVPTAAAPEGEEAFLRTAALGVDHFRSLGAEVEAVLIRDRTDANDPAFAQAIGEADLIYVTAGRPAFLLDALAGSLAWESARSANERGAILAGCSAGAMALAGRQVDLRVRFGWPLRWRLGLDLAHGIGVIPSYDRRPEPFVAMLALRAPRDTTILGIDAGTAVVGRDGSWQVHGPARVTVWTGRRRERHRDGDVFRIGSQDDD